MCSAEHIEALGPGAVTGRPRLWLRGEGAVLLVAAVAGYATTGMSWWFLALVALLPDAFIVGYAAGSRVGAGFYNLAHTTPLPAALALLGLLTGTEALVGLALVWFAHIGMDRAAGYGLKYGRGFQHTHLGRIGHAGADV